MNPFETPDPSPATAFDGSALPATQPMTFVCIGCGRWAAQVAEAVAASLERSGHQVLTADDNSFDALSLANRQVHLIGLIDPPAGALTSNLRESADTVLGAWTREASGLLRIATRMGHDAAIFYTDDVATDTAGLSSRLHQLWEVDVSFDPALPSFGALPSLARLLSRKLLRANAAWRQLAEEIEVSCQPIGKREPPCDSAEWAEAWDSFRKHWTESDELRGQVAELLPLLQAARTEAIAHHQERALLGEALAASRVRSEQLEQELDFHRERALAIERIQAELDQSHEERVHLHQTESRLKQEIVEQQGEAAALLEQLHSTQLLVARLDRERIEVQDKLALRTQQNDDSRGALAACRANLEKSLGEGRDLQQKLRTLRSEHTALQSEVDELAKERRRIQGKFEGSMAAAASANEQVLHLEGRLRDQQAVDAQLREQVEALEEEQAHFRREAETREAATQGETRLLLLQLHHVQEALELASLSPPAPAPPPPPPPQASLRVVSEFEADQHRHLNLSIDNLVLETGAVPAPLLLRLVCHRGRPGLLLWDAGTARHGVLHAWSPNGEEAGRGYELLIPQDLAGRRRLEQLGHRDWAVLRRLVNELVTLLGAADTVASHWASVAALLQTQLESLETRLRYDGISVGATHDTSTAPELIVSFEQASMGRRDLGRVVLRWRPNAEVLALEAPPHPCPPLLSSWGLDENGRLQSQMPLPVGNAYDSRQWARLTAADRMLLLSLLDALPTASRTMDASVATSLSVDPPRLEQAAQRLRRRAQRAARMLRLRELLLTSLRRRPSTD